MSSVPPQLSQGMTTHTLSQALHIKFATLCNSGGLYETLLALGVQCVCVSRSLRIPDTVHDKAKELSEQKDMSLKEAIRTMCREGGYDV